MHWQTRRFSIDLNRPRVMGIVNVTPDSFSDGGQHGEAASAIAHCERLVAEGADILDIGGESTRPGAAVLADEEEWRRIAPVIRAALSLGVPLSVDTCKPAVMQRAMDAGVDIVNDVQALRRPGALEILAAHESAGICLMHMRGEPSTMQGLADYDDVVAEVSQFLAAQAARLRAAGIASERIVLDPGYGFAKNSEQNLQLLRGQEKLLALGYPLLVGWSRKKTLGEVTGKPVDQRMPASIAAALLALSRGARVLRVHDVSATVDALKVWQAGDGPAALFADNGQINNSGGSSQ